MSEALSWPRPPLAAEPREPCISRAVHRRFGWSTPAARELWGPRLAGLCAAAHAIELHQVRTGTLPATLFWAAFHELGPFLAKIAALELVAVPIGGILERNFHEGAVDSADPRTALTYPIMVGTSETLKTTLDLMARKDLRKIAAWFNYPDCCAEAWLAAQTAGATDPVLAMLRSHSTHDPAESGAAYAILAEFGFGPVRHAMCTVHCRHAAARIQEFIAVGREIGFASEMSWLAQMAEWDIDYSVVAGVAEIRTALFRSTHFSDRVEQPVRFRQPGRPSTGGAPGGRDLPIHFPAPAGAMNPSRVAAKLAAANSARCDFGTGWAAAGFAGPFEMRSRFCTVIWEQTKLLRGKVSSVLQISCGEGLLLELALEVNPRIVPFGCDTDANLVAVACRRHPKHADNFSTDEGFASMVRCREILGKPVDVLFLDPEALVDMPAHLANAIRSELADAARSVIVIASDRALARFGNIGALADAAGLSIAPADSDRISAVVVPERTTATKYAFSSTEMPRVP